VFGRKIAEACGFCANRADFDKYVSSFAEQRRFGQPQVSTGSD
jgi:hypothetical protein